MSFKHLAVGLISPLGVTLMLQANSAIANPLTVTVGGTDYQVEKFTGSLSDLLSSSLLTPPPSENFPWWDDSDLAIEFATAYNTADGDNLQQVMNNGVIDVTFGPLFYLSDSSGDVTFSAWNFDNAAYDAGLCNVQFNCSITSLKWVYVQSPAAPVPAPIPLLGAAAAFTSSRRLRRRLNARKFTF